MVPQIQKLISLYNKLFLGDSSTFHKLMKPINLINVIFLRLAFVPGETTISCLIPDRGGVLVLSLSNCMAEVMVFATEDRASLRTSVEERRLPVCSPAFFHINPTGGSSVLLCWPETNASAQNLYCVPL